MVTIVALSKPEFFCTPVSPETETDSRAIKNYWSQDGKINSQKSIKYV